MCWTCGQAMPASSRRFAASLWGPSTSIRISAEDIYPGCCAFEGGRRFPFILQGKLRRTPQETLNLRPGELVRVKSKQEIVQTLDMHNKNRGMSFDAEMLKYCGRQARVLRRVERIIDERTGRMQYLKNPCIVLEDAICTSDYHRLCPRGIYAYWREIWLERAE